MRQVDKVSASDSNRSPRTPDGVRDPVDGGLSAQIDFRRDPGFRLKLEFHSNDLSGESRVLGVYGASGAGKTSLLHLWAGLLTPRSGYLRLGSREFYSAGGVKLSPAARRVGYVFQDTRLFPHLSVRRNILYGAAVRGTTDLAVPRFDFEEVVAVLGLADLLERSGDRLSGGQQKRAAIARALLAQPDLLLCDEATTNLDASSRAAFLQLMRGLPANVRCIYVSHDLAELARLTDEILVLDRGELLYHGSPSRLTADVALREFFARSGALPPLVIRRDQMRLPSPAREEFRISNARFAANAPARERMVFDAERLHLARTDSGELTGFADRWPARFQELVEWDGRLCARVSLFEEDSTPNASGPVALIALDEADRAIAGDWRPGETLVCLVPATARL